jgi:hypothetical protein
MIRDTKPGRIVRVRYAKKKRQFHKSGIHNAFCVIYEAATGYPKNVLVKMYSTMSTEIIPIGNLFDWKKEFKS